MPFDFTVIVALPVAFPVTVTVVTLPLLDVETVATLVSLDVTVTETSSALLGEMVAVNVVVPLVLE